MSCIRTPLEWAIIYLREGMSVMPLRKRTKKPALDTWKELQRRLPTEAELREWFADDEGVAIIGGAVSRNLAILDFDNQEAYWLWAEVYPKLSENAPTVRTAKGHHVYVRVAELPRTGRFRVSGIEGTHHGEIRAEGAYACAPFAIHPSGHIYEWVVPFAAPPVLDNIADAGIEVVAGVRLVDTNNSEGEWVADLYGATVNEGERNETITSLAGYLRHSVPEPVGVAILRDYNVKHCSPPLPERELIATVNGVYQRYGFAPPPTWQSSNQALDYDCENVGGLVFLTPSEFIARAPNPPGWLIDRIVPCGTLLLVGGKPKVGKTLITLDMAQAVANGTPLYGEYEVASPGTVLLCNLEDDDPLIRQRLESLSLSENVKVLARWLTYTEPRAYPALLQQEGIGALGQAIEHYQAKLLIIDPLADAARMKDENDNSEVIRWLRPIRELAQRSGCTVAVVHHHRKGEGSGGDEFRGGSALTGAVSGWLSCKRRGHSEPFVEVDCVSKYAEAHRFALMMEDGHFLLGNAPALEHQEATESVKDVLASEPMTAAQIAEKSDLPRRTVNQALSELRVRRVVVVARKDGNAPVYALAQPGNRAYSARLLDCEVEESE